MNIEYITNVYLYDSCEDINDLVKDFVEIGIEGLEVADLEIADDFMDIDMDIPEEFLPKVCYVDINEDDTVFVGESCSKRDDWE